MTGRSTCSQCAAPLPPADADGNQVCATCGRFHHGELDGPAGAPEPPPAPGPSAPGAGTSGAGPFGGAPPGGPGVRQGTYATAGGPAFGTATATPPRRRRSGNGVGCAIVLVILAAVMVPFVAGVVIYASRGDSDGSSGGSAEDLSPSSGDLLVLPDEEGPVRAVVLASVVGTSDRVVALVSLDGDVAWQAPVVPGDVYSAQFEITDDLVLASLGHEIVALDRRTGAEEWRVETPDEVRTDCDECLALLGDDRLLAFSADAQASVIDLASGELQWSRRLTSAIGTARAFDGDVLITDDAENPAAEVVVALLDGTSGEEVVSFAPSCPDPAYPDETDIVLTPYVSTPISRVPGTDDVVLAFGSGRMCAQRWDVPTGQVQWSRSTEVVSITSDEAGVVGATDLVIPGSSELIRVGLAEGSITVIALPPDTQPAGPLTLVGSHLVAALQTTRGTPTWVLTGFDLRSGAEEWSRPLPRDLEPFPLDSPFSTLSISEGTGGFVTAVDGDGLVLVTVTSTGQRVTTERVDPASGEGEVVGTASFRTSYESTSHQVQIEDVAPDRIVLTASSVVQVLDLATGSITDAFTR